MSGYCTHGVSLESPCVKCAMTAPVVIVNPPGIDNAVAAERARIRAIVLELFGSEWAGNTALEWIDSGLTVEQLKEGKK